MCVCVSGGVVLIFLYHEKEKDEKIQSVFISLIVLIYSDANIKLNIVNRETESVCLLSGSAIFGMLTETTNLTYHIR